MRRRASIGLWLSVAMLAALSGCVELTGQRITWFYDQAKDELQILLYYDGIHDSGSGTEPGTIANFVRDGNVMLLDWPFHVQMAEPLMLELGHFVECIREDKPSYVSGEAGLYALQLAQAVADQVNNLMILGEVSPNAVD